MVPPQRKNAFTPLLIAGVVGGLLLGTVTGLMMNDFGLWVSLGLMFGVIVASVIFFVRSGPAK